MIGKKPPWVPYLLKEVSKLHFQIYIFSGLKFAYKNICHTLEDFSKFNPPFKSTVSGNMEIMYLFSGHIRTLAGGSVILSSIEWHRTFTLALLVIVIITSEIKQQTVFENLINPNEHAPWYWYLCHLNWTWLHLTGHQYFRCNNL